MPSIGVTEKLSTILKPKPVFNKPLSTKRQHHMSHVLHMILLSLFAGLSVAVISLKAKTLGFIEDNHDTGFVFETGKPDPPLLAALPQHLYTGPAKLALIAAAISIFVGMGHVALLILDCRTGERTQGFAFRRNVMLVHLSNSLFVLFALISVYVAHNMSSHFKEDYVLQKANNGTLPGNSNSDDGPRYGIGKFDLETWSCGFKDVQGAFMVWEDYGKQCSIEVAGRIIMIPFLILAFGVAGLSVIQMIRTKRSVQGQSRKSEDFELGSRKSEDDELESRKSGDVKLERKSEDVKLEMGKYNAV